jgi:hypothetical protein
LKRHGLVLLLYVCCAWVLHAAGFDLTRNLLGGGDAYLAGFPAKLFAATFSPWNPYVQLGQYTFANTQFQPFYPPGLLLIVLFPNTFGYNCFVLLHYVLAGYFCYLFCRELELEEPASFLGGLFFLGSGFLMAHKGHQAMMSTTVWLPLMLFFAARHARTGRRREATFAGLAVAASLLGGFPQMTVYGLMLVAAFWFWKAGRRAVAGLAICGLFAFLFSSLQLLAVAETLPLITRQALTPERFNENYLPLPYFFGFFLPNILGGMHRVPSYGPGGDVVEVFVYCGLAPVLLALAALRRRETYFWVAVAVVAAVLMVGWGPIQAVLFRVPVYNLFRAPARHMQELHLALAVLAAYGFHERKRIAWPTVAVGLAILVAVGLAHWLPVFANPGLTVPQAEYWRAVSLRWPHPSVLFPVLALAATGACLFFRAPGWLLGLVFLLDVGSVHRTIYDNPDTTDLYGAERRAEVKYLFDQGLDPQAHRILPLDLPLFHTYPLLSMMYGLSTANDYTPMWMRRYQTLTGFDLSGSGGEAIVGQRQLLSAFNIRYVLAKSPASAFAVRRTRLYEELAKSQDGVTVFGNPAAAPRFRFARRLIPVRDLPAAKAVLFDPAQFDPVRDATVEGLASAETMAEGRILKQETRNNALAWTVETQGRAFLVVTDTWFPGWTATVNGLPVPIEIVNGCVRGVFVPAAGRHEIRMSFWPWSVTAGLALTGLGLLLLPVGIREPAARKKSV